MVLLLIIVTFTFLILRLLVAGYNYFSAPVLKSRPFVFSSLVSILVPARDEEHNIRRLLNSLLVQKGVSLEIIVLDDHSVDRTRAIVEEYSNKHSNIKLLPGQALPEGWTGKNFACHQLAQAANGRYLVFLDADVELHPELITSGIQQMRTKNLSLLSLFCKQQIHTFGEKITVPLMNYLLFTLLPIRLIESHSYPIFSAACGQFMMFTAENYQHYKWHNRARGRITEDLAIMKMVKQNGEKGEGLLSGNLMTCRMYTGFADAVNGFSKNFITPFNDSISLFLIFLAIVIVGPILILSSTDPYMIAGLLLILTLIRFFTGRLSGEKIWQILLHPLQMSSLLYIGLVSVYRRCTKSVSWKGRTLPVTKADKDHAFREQNVLS
ncbi:MAG: glycosyltransferase family 2 protein [Pedobacter sp.]